VPQNVLGMGMPDLPTIDGLTLQRF
jgi:hypothetical protein